MGKLQFNADDEGGLELARAIVLERLKHGEWDQYDLDGSGFEPFVEYQGDAGRGKTRLCLLARDVLWELMIQGVVAPGRSLHDPNLPWFHTTEYGEKVLSAGEMLPHDPTGFLDRFKSTAQSAVDETVLAYLTESLNCFTRANLVASVVMLGVASERVFLILCDDLLAALSDPSERASFEKILDRRAMKPKMDWVLSKITAMQSQGLRPLPDNVNVMLAAIFDFIRTQRNELGHPQPSPPAVTREEAYTNLRIFPSYYLMCERVVAYLRRHSC